MDFTVEHKAGAKIAHVDAFSRQVGMVMNERSLNREAILQGQASDEFCQNRPGTYSGKREFFLDEDGLIYRRQTHDRHQLVVPRSLIHQVIEENHDLVYVAHPGVKRTHHLISLNYWWPGMRWSIEDYIKKCDPCQRRKGNREFIAPLGDVEEPGIPFQVTSMEITGPYPLTPHGNKIYAYVDHFLKYVEAYPVKDQTAETCATQIVTRHSIGSTLITDQGPAFMSAFFNETCKALGIRKIRTTSYHPTSNGMVERLHRSLHTGLSHFIDASHTNWDTIVPFYLMAYRTTPNTTTGYSPFFLLHGREMPLPSNDNLKAKVSSSEPDLNRRIETLKAT